MKKIVLIIILTTILISMASAEVIITQQPKTSYNLGEIVSVPAILKSTTDIVGSFNADLICNGQQINFYKNGVSLKAGEEKRMDPSLVLTRELIGGLEGECKIKTYIESEYALTNDFKITSVINLKVETSTPEIFPGESFIIKGTATKESGAEVKGFAEVKISAESITADLNPIIDQLASVNNGYFQVNITAPKDMKAGNYIITARVYERDSTSSITNEGSSTTSIRIKQFPTNLEIFIETPEVNPGTSAKIKVILHDQTGESIETNTTIKVNTDKGKLLEKLDTATGQSVEFPIAYNEPPAIFKVTASSSGLESESSFKIKEKQDIGIQIINGTLIITNKGNVPYCNKTVLIKIGNQTLNIDVCLGIDEDQKYKLSAPDGEYEVEIITDNDRIKEKVFLTGSAIDIKEGSGAISLSRHPFIWVFVILILGFVAFTIFRKGYKRSFIGNIAGKKGIKEPEKTIKIEKGSLIPAKERAEISLSIKGNQQDISIVGLKLKNFAEILENKESVKETLERIANIADGSKAFTHENQSNILFIFAPIKTKTFQNEAKALKLAQDLKSVIDNHNKIFKQKIDFGISLNYGSLVAKAAQNGLEFMPLGDLMAKVKKIAFIAKEDILLGEKMKEKLGPNVRVEKMSVEGLNVYKIKEIKDTQAHEKFIKQFLNRQTSERR